LDLKSHGEGEGEVADHLNHQVQGLRAVWINNLICSL